MAASKVAIVTHYVQNPDGSVKYEEKNGHRVPTTENTKVPFPMEFKFHNYNDVDRKIVGPYSIFVKDIVSIDAVFIIPEKGLVNITIDADIAKEILPAINERMRQISVEGWSHEHDDNYKFGELGNAAASYLVPPLNREMTYRYDVTASGDVPTTWPLVWGPSWFKPAKDPNNIYQRMRELEKGIALGLAEYGRLNRLKEEEMRNQAKGLAE